MSGALVGARGTSDVVSRGGRVPASALPAAQGGGVGDLAVTSTAALELGELVRPLPESLPWQT